MNNVQSKRDSIARTAALFLTSLTTLMLVLLTAAWVPVWQCCLAFVGIACPYYFLVIAKDVSSKSSARIISLIGLCLLALLVGSTAVRIEIANASAGGRLARDVEGIREVGGNPKWRVSRESEDYWVRWLLNAENDDRDTATLKTTLSQEQLDELGRIVTQAKANNHLRRLTFAGLQQYLYVPVLFVLALGLAWAYRPGLIYSMVCLLCVLVAMVAGGLAWYRAYLTSTLGSM